MSRQVPFDKDAICDDCGKQGAFDFMGDYFCEDCARKYTEKEDENTNTTTNTVARE